MASGIGFNQGQPLTGLPDYRVGELVKKNVPSETFTSIHVVTERHRFPGTTLEVTTRKVTLEISKLNLGWNCVEAFLKALLAVEGGAASSSPDSQLILKQLTGNCSQAGLDEVKKAYKECFSITLYISDDCNFCELGDMTQSTHYVMAKRAGTVVAFIVKTGLMVAAIAAPGANR